MILWIRFKVQIKNEEINTSFFYPSIKGYFLSLLLKSKSRFIVVAILRIRIRFVAFFKNSRLFQHENNDN